MTPEEERAKLVARLNELDSQTTHRNDFPVEVTVCVLACREGRKVIDVMEALWSQGVQMDLLLALDEQCGNWTRPMFEWNRVGEFMTTHKSRTIRSCRYIGEIPHRKRPEDIEAFAKAAFMEHVTTEWVWWSDADVVLDPGTIRTALKWMKENPDVGAGCVKYPPPSDHYEEGAMLMRCDTAREIGFDGRPDGQTRCVCMNVERDLKAKGLRVAPIPDVDAWHRKWG